MRTVIYLILLSSVHFCRAQTLYFPPTNGQEWQEESPESLGWCEENIPDLIAFLEEKQTRGFIVLKDGKIVIEEYLNGHTQDSVWYWASAGKSLNAFEIGMLQEQGMLNISDSTADYLGESWTSCSAEEEKSITIRNQLTMTTGLDFLGGVDLDCTEPSCLECANIPGDQWFYHNAPYTLLSNIIENVTDRSHTLHTFLTLGNSIGLSGLWIPSGYNKVFISTTRVMARFGLLMNAKGEWNGQTILGDEDYFNAMITPSQDINQSYGYLWWLNTGPTYRLPSTTITFPGKMIPNAPDHLYMALGRNSQLILVDPIENIVIIRTGDDPDESPVPTIFINELWEKIENIICVPTSVKDSNRDDISVFPNPFDDHLTIQSAKPVSSFILHDIHGRIVKKGVNPSKINTHDLKPGVYSLTINTDEEVVIRKVIKR